MTKKKGDPGEPLALAGSRISRIHGFKTMIIVSDYELEYNEKKQIFSKEQ